MFTYGNRNVQGVTVQPGTDRIFVSEHGPRVDDEINILRAGVNYGWDLSRGGTQNSYDESVPMTDLARFPDAVPAVWSSGGNTEAICGAAFITGEHLTLPTVRSCCVAAIRVASETTLYRCPTCPPPGRSAWSGLDAAGPAA